MTIRFVIEDRATGEILTTEAPRSGEHVSKKGRRFIPPNVADTDNLMEVIKVRSKLGARGGCLA